MKKENLITFLRKTLHTTVSKVHDESDYLEKISLVLRKNYPISNMKIYDKIISIVEVENPSQGSIYKHFEILNEAIDYPVVLYFSKDAKILRNYFIERNVPFIIEDDTIYLPQFAVYAADFSKTIKQKTKNKKLSRSAQRALLYILFNTNQEFTISQLSNVLRISEMSASRAFNELYEQEILLMRKEGRVKNYQLTQDDDLLNGILDRMKAPKNDVIYINKNNMQYFEPVKLSGSSALAKYTNLIENIRTYAIEKKTGTKILKNNLFIEVFDEAYDRDFIKIEMWDYAPESFTDSLRHINDVHDIVDPISLYLNYKKDMYENSDTRLVDAINQLFNQVKGIIHG